LLPPNTIDREGNAGANDKKNTGISGTIQELIAVKQPLPEALLHGFNDVGAFLAAWEASYSGLTTIVVS
jgi:hypothetical protein